ncbi:MAG: succinate dehydrogenase, cytochrome b556 subunit [Gammaproteobacteria bacterium]|nr:succinate dehydrogenase, cytochrome b556 subunit [Gammaproteobacteria bacterium]
MALNNNNRPVFLDLTRIHLPVTAVLSIAHRLAGVLLFLFIPLSIYLLQRSLRDAQGFQSVVATLGHPGWRALLIMLIWAFAHHLFAGLRFLLLDIEVGVDRDRSRHSAWLVIIAGIAMTLFASVCLV